MTPSISVGMRAQVMPNSFLSPSKLSGSSNLKANPNTVAIGARVIYRLSQLSSIPNTSLPSNCWRQIIPVSGIEPASDPASGLVNAKQGISCPFARRGR